MEVPLLGQEKPEGDEQAGGLLEVEHAFLVFKTKDGNYGISPDINIPVSVENTPNIIDVKAGLLLCLDQIRVQESAAVTAQQVMGAQVQMARQVMEQQQNEAALKQVKNMRA